MSLETLARLEETALSNWLRESGPAFFSALTLHSLAMAFVIGINIAICLQITGAAKSIPLDALRKFYPLHWCGVAVILASGLALLLAYPAKALTNPVFYLKLAALMIALGISRVFQGAPDMPDRHAHTTNVRLAYLALLLWIITITAVRFLAYTNSVLLASRFY